jgi:hypothetical protein
MIDVVVRLEVLYDLQATNRREGGDTSCRGRSQEAPGPHLERARDRAGGSRTAWCADYRRGSARPGGGGGEVIYTFIAVRNTKNSEKRAGFAHVLAYNSPKTPFFALKYLTRYTHETFFEEYVNFKIFRNLSHCGVIPVRSFGSHIRSQPHGLGLKNETELHTAVCKLLTDLFQKYEINK